MRELLREHRAEVVAVARGTTRTHELLRSRLLVLFLATVVLDAIASVLIFVFERHASGTEVTSFGDSVLDRNTELTVSSSLRPDLTPEACSSLSPSYAITRWRCGRSFGASFGRDTDPTGERST